MGVVLSVEGEDGCRVGARTVVVGGGPARSVVAPAHEGQAQPAVFLQVLAMSGGGGEPQTLTQASLRLVLVTAMVGSATYSGSFSPSMALISVWACMAPWASSTCAPPPISWLPLAMLSANWVPRSWLVTGMVEP